MIYVCYFAFIEYISSRKYRSSFKLTVTRLNNNNNMYPLPFFYLNWEIHSRLYNTSSTYNAIPSEIMHECLGAFLVR